MSVISTPIRELLRAEDLFGNTAQKFSEETSPDPLRAESAAKRIHEFAQKYPTLGRTPSGETPSEPPVPMSIVTSPTTPSKPLLQAVSTHIHELSMISDPKGLIKGACSLLPEIRTALHAFAPAPKTPTTESIIFPPIEIKREFPKAIMATADDEGPIRKLLERYLSKDHLKEKILMSDGAESTIRLLENHGHIMEVLFLDNDLKDGLGADLIHIIRRNPSWSEITVIFLTTTDFSETYKDLGFDAYLQKPVSKDQVIRCLSKLYLELSSRDDRRWITNNLKK